jgi:DNA-binding Lrp family transcriptional regulator
MEFRELDRIDFEILSALRKNARLPNNRLAERVGVAPSTCLERTRRLHADGVLKGFHAEVDHRALGIHLHAMIAVRLTRHRREQVDTLHDELLELPEVISVYHVAGANDFLVHVGVRDSDALRDLVLEVFVGRPDVAHVETSLIFEHARTWKLPRDAERIS